VLYLDANVFIFAALSTKEYGSRAEALLDRMQGGEEMAITSALTFDEVFWEVKRNRGVEKAIETTEALLNFPNLEIVATDRQVALAALNLIKKYRLAPRDALHAATALSLRVDYFVTTDSDFSKVTELKIRNL
jgi:predicted nucleic acid-binding protein